ncbi:MAG: hypothetical protein OEZ28_00950 [Nitrospinota bacterium]|nr:hypothetical protein [Nitrospinota bacterium]
MFTDLLPTLAAITLFATPAAAMEHTTGMEPVALEYPAVAQADTDNRTWSMWPEKKSDEEQEQSQEQEQVDTEYDETVPDPSVQPSVPAPSERSAPGATQPPTRRSAPAATRPPARRSAPAITQPSVPAPSRRSAPADSQRRQTQPPPTQDRQPEPGYPSIYRRPEPERTEQTGPESGSKSFYPWRGGEETNQQGYGPPVVEDTTPYGNYDYIEARIGFWGTSFTAEVQSGVEGSSIDLSSELGMGTTKTVVVMGASARLSDSVRIWADTFNVNYLATARLKKELIFKDVLFKVNTEVESEIQVKSTRIGLDASLVNGKHGHFNLGLAADLLNTSTRLTAYNLITTTASINIGLPMVTGSVRVYPVKMIGLGMDAAWIGFDKSKLYDIAFYADVNPLKNVGVSLGWRGITLDVNTDTEKVYVGWNGLFGQVTARF